MPERISVSEAREKMDRQDALLVCAYEDREKCRSFGIEESISHPELEEKADTLSPSRHLVFFCA